MACGVLVAESLWVEAFCAKCVKVLLNKTEVLTKRNWKGRSTLQACTCTALGAHCGFTQGASFPAVLVRSTVALELSVIKYGEYTVITGIYTWI